MLLKLTQALDNVMWVSLLHHLTSSGTLYKDCSGHLSDVLVRYH